MICLSENFKRDRVFAMIENRGLVSLLKDRSLELYHEFLQTPPAYQNYIRKWVKIHDGR